MPGYMHDWHSVAHWAVDTQSYDCEPFWDMNNMQAIAMEMPVIQISCPILAQVCVLSTLWMIEKPFYWCGTGLSAVVTV